MTTTVTIAPEGAQLSPPRLGSASPPGASQPAQNSTEPTTAASTCTHRAEGAVLSRRSLMNKLVAFPIVAAIPTAAPSIATELPPSNVKPVDIIPPAHADAELLALADEYVVA